MKSMGWLEKLKSLFNIEINEPIIKFNWVNNSYNKTEIKNTPTYFDENERKLYLNLDEVSPAQKSELKKIIKDSINEGDMLLQESTDILLEDICKYKKENTDNQILEFFKPIIPPFDYEALEASLYVRAAFKRHDEINKLKEDIRETFGVRGNTIANLCSAGYFENFFIPLYNSSPDKFESLYEDIVRNALIAVFVHKDMSEPQILEKIKDKLKLSKKYGIKFIHIHGISELNRSKILKSLKVLEKEEEMKDSFYVKILYNKESIIIVELLLK